MPRQKKITLKKRKDGRYRCKYKDQQFYGNSPEEADSLRQQYIDDEKKGFKRQKVHEYALPWLKRTYPAVAESTYTGLAIHLQHLIDEIGEMQVSEVVPSNIKEVYAKHYKNLSNSYIRSAKQLYCSLFDSAMADGLCRFNPAREKAAKPHSGKSRKSASYQSRNGNGSKPFAPITGPGLR